MVWTQVTGSLHLVDYRNKKSVKLNIFSFAKNCKKESTCIDKPSIMDTHLIWTPHYHEQFALLLSKESPYILISLNSTRLIWTPR